MEKYREITWKDKKKRKEERASRWRRLRTPVFCLGGAVLLCFVGFPLLFETMYPISVMEEIRPISTISPIVTPVPPGAQAEAKLEEKSGMENMEALSFQQEAVLSSMQTDSYTLLQYGDEDPFVANIQTRLMELGYIDGDEPTEYFGPATQAGIKSFQQTHHMNETGIADELTQRLLFSPDAKRYSLEKGNDGSDVVKLQKQLMDLEYYSDKVNGYFGLATERALKAFQTKNKLAVTGIADTDTFDVLYSSHARPAVDPTPTPTPKPTKKPSATKKPSSGSSVSTPKPSSGSSSSGITVVGNGLETFISVALAQEGKPYILGDEGPSSYDCSGLVYYSLRSAGVSVGRMSAKNYAKKDSWATIYSYSDLRRGDLLFFTNSVGASTIGHTGIYLGGGTFIHASSSRGMVVVSSWSKWCEQNFQWGKRVF